MPHTQLTTSHDQIKDWAETRGAEPAEVSETSNEGPGVLRFKFSDSESNKELRQIPWSDFFDKMDDKHLAMIYQEKTRSGDLSRFSKFVYAPQGALQQLHEEHEKVKKVLSDLASTTSNATKTRPKLLEKLEELLVPHMAGEEQVVYKRLKKHASDEESMEILLEGYEEHKHTKSALSRLKKADPESTDFHVRVMVLQELVEHHIEEEESEMFEFARNALGLEGLEDLEDSYLAKKEQKLSRL